jgi:hypothetical protein
VLEAAVLKGSAVVLEAVGEAVDEVGAMEAAASAALGTKGVDNRGEGSGGGCGRGWCDEGCSIRCTSKGG